MRHAPVPILASAAGHLPFLAAAVAVAVAAAAAGARAETTAGTTFSPEGPGLGNYRISVAGQLDLLPTQLVESEQRLIPEIAVNFRVGLPWRLSTELRYDGVYIKNQADLGLIWSYDVFGDSLQLGIAYRFGGRFGFLSGSGFNAKTWDLMHRPGFIVGTRWGDHRFNLSWEYLFGMTYHFSFGDLSGVQNPDSAYDGQVVTLTMETPLKSGGVFFVGGGIIFTRAYDQVWMAFSDFYNRIRYPRFYVGYEF